MTILDCREIKNNIIKDIKNKVSKLPRKPTLAVISTMDDESSKIYVNSKKKMCEDIGYDFRYFECSDMSESEISDIILKLNNYDDVDGILLQLPVRDGLDANKLISLISYKKDVDGLTDINMGKVINDNSYLCSCTDMGIIKLLDAYNIDISGKNVVIIGRSRLVGKSLANLFLNRDATVCVCHSKSKDISFYTKNADIVVVCVGKQKFLNADMVKNGSIVIDVGIHRLDNGSIVGDCDFDSLASKVSYITPVPFGVGQMTVAMLAVNIYMAYIKNNDN